MGSRSLEGQPRNIFKKAAKFAPLPLMIVTFACTPTIDIPDCTKDPQSLTKTVVLNYGEEIKIDKVYLSQDRLNINNRILIRQPQQPHDHRASTFPDAHIEFEDTKNGRHYSISKDPSRSDSEVTVLTIQADCEIPQTKP